MNMKKYSFAGAAGLLGAIFLLGAIKTARAELVVSAFSGFSDTYDSDLHLHENNGTDLTFHNASYSTKDFGENAPYYGGRLTYFLSRESHWGFGLEFLHSKVFLDSGESLHVTGTRDGSPVNDTEYVGNTIADFHCAHGLNYLTADTIYRFFLGQPDNFIHRFQPYLGAGVGITIPHVVVQLANEPGFENYEFGGLGMQAIAGLSFDITKHVQLFSEYKFTYADLDKLEFSNGETSGTVSFNSMANHLVFGVSYRF
jgi:lipid A oxidase